MKKKQRKRKMKTIEKIEKNNPDREGAEGVEGYHLIISNYIVDRNILTSDSTSSDLF